MEFDVSIIIVNYHTSGLIADCVRSIYEKTTGIRYEIIIVDNNSEPDLPEIIGKLVKNDLTKSIRYIDLPENIGFGRANNEGVKMATGRNILFLNPDTLLVNNAIKILSDFLDQHDRAGGCGGNLLDEEECPIFSYKKFLPGLEWEINELFNNKIQEIIYGNRKHYFNDSEKAKKVGYITGADLMVKMKVIEKIGCFSPEFFMYYEETDLCARIRKAGFILYSVPQAKIIHLESKSFSDSASYQSELKTKMIENSRKIYNRRNLPIWKQKICDVIYNLFLLSRIKLVRNNNKRQYYILRRKFFKQD